MELSMEIATAAEKIKEQKALHMENTVTATVVDAIQNQIANCKAYFIETLQDDQRVQEKIEGAKIDNTLFERESISEPVCVDVAAQIIFLDDLQNLVSRVEINPAQEAAIEQARQTDQFFCEDFLDQTRAALAAQINDLSPDQQEVRQQLANQEQVFAVAREALERDLVQAFSLGNEQNLQDVHIQCESVRQELDGFHQQLAGDVADSERPDLLAQAGSVAADLEHYQRLAWLVDTVIYNQECLDSTRLLNELRPPLPVVIDPDGLPIQQFGTSALGEAYHSEAEARQAAETEYQQRLADAATDKAREEISYPHVLQVEIKDKEENTVCDWWEVSERGQLQREGHTEQKMATRIDFSVMSDEGYSLVLRGDNPPCNTNHGCDMLLHYLAEKHDVNIIYRDFDENEHHYG
jgi:hypothetical protein